MATKQISELERLEISEQDINFLSLRQTNRETSRFEMSTKRLTDGGFLSEIIYKADDQAYLFLSETEEDVEELYRKHQESPIH